MLGAPPPPDRESARNSKRAELKQFLRARRSAIAPEEIGVPRGARRLAPGLRREEVAAAAGVGLSWYTWLEQGRDINISANALSRVATALRLTDADRAYLFWLADLPHPAPPMLATDDHARLQAILDGHRWPAFAVDRIWNMLAFNRLAEHLYSFDDVIPPFPINQLWQVMMNPARQALYPDYDQDVRHFVALFRLGSASSIGDPAFNELFATLSRTSPMFVRLWDERHIEAAAPRPLRIRHREWGLVTFLSMRLPLPSKDGGMVIFLSPSDDATAKAWSSFDQ